MLLSISHLILQKSGRLWSYLRLILFIAKDKVEGEASINYLTEQVARTGYTEIRKVIADLAQREMQKMTLIEATEYYVFDVIDPPVVMEKKSSPARATICIIGAILGGIIGVIIVLLRHYLRS